MDIKKTEYKNFLVEVKEKIQKSRNDALKSVNKELINLYWEIGKKLSEKINNSGWGKSVVENLSSDLQKEFPGIQGFSKRNLWNMIRFYDFYSQNKKLQPLVAEISWSSNIVILEKCKDELQIEYYLKIANKTHLSKRVLQNKIESQEFERTLSENKTNNFDFTLKEENKQKFEVEMSLIIKKFIKLYKICVEY